MIECNGRTVFREAAQVCLQRYENNSSPVSKELDSAICAVCFRCLPAKALPFELIENPLNFALPVEAERQPAEDQSGRSKPNGFFSSHFDLSMSFVVFRLRRREQRGGRSCRGKKRVSFPDLAKKQPYVPLFRPRTLCKMAKIPRNVSINASLLNWRKNTERCARN